MWTNIYRVFINYSMFGCEEVKKKKHEWARVSQLCYLCGWLGARRQSQIWIKRGSFQTDVQECEEKKEGDIFIHLTPQPHQKKREFMASDEHGHAQNSIFYIHLCIFICIFYLKVLIWLGFPSWYSCKTWFSWEMGGRSPVFVQISIQFSFVGRG